MEHNEIILGIISVIKWSGLALGALTLYLAAAFGPWLGGVQKGREMEQQQLAKLFRENPKAFELKMQQEEIRTIGEEISKREAALRELELNKRRLEKEARFVAS